MSDKAAYWKSKMTEETVPDDLHKAYINASR